MRRKMENFEVSADEKQLILNRRKLFAERQKSCPMSNGKPCGTKDAILGENRPKGWDNHNDLNQVHKGRVTENNPLYWFEDEIFRKIGNKNHQQEHKKIHSILGLPIQSHTRDRAYHILSHMTVLWVQKRLPLKYKVREQEIRDQYGVGVDNVPAGQKKEGVVYPQPKIEIPQFKAEWFNVDESEEFTGEVYDYTKYLKDEFKNDPEVLKEFKKFIEFEG